MEELQKRLSNLLTIKSMVTLILTVVFACLTCGGRVSAEEFLTVFVKKIYRPHCLIIITEKHNYWMTHIALIVTIWISRRLI